MKISIERQVSPMNATASCLVKVITALAMPCYRFQGINSPKDSSIHGTMCCELFTLLRKATECGFVAA